MKEAYWGYWLILLGVFIVVVMILTSDATTSNTQTYYQLKEVADSAIYDSMDYSYYSQTGQVRMMKEVFVENFLRRFAESVSMTDTYVVEFYDLYESPPKVSIKVSTKTGQYLVAGDSTALDVVNNLDLIVEFDSLGTPGSYKEAQGCPYYG